ncbi:MAG: DNA primase DnaG [Acidilobaceae archaeon]|nr:DNA primase DnaG [Acidilobaceae archaeon]MDW7974349.1 DNA primase DnaG [Sulfolobales archaeon]
MKYLIKARIEIDGKVDKHDVIGAIFGQTEGLLGQEFDLEDLQEKDKIGRMQVDLKQVGSKTVGSIQLPSNLDRVETAVLAAMLEVIDRVGPYAARVVVEDIKDLRTEKLKIIIERAKEIIKKIRESEPDIKEVLRQVEGEVERAPRVIEYGPEKLPAGPDVEGADTVIVVEGRADVINLLKYGYTNVIAVEGAKESLPESVKRLAQNKKVILFVDGDRGGELIATSAIGQIKVDYVARAPKGREVEQLTGREIAKALSEMVPAEEFLKELRPPEQKPEQEVKEQKVEVKEEQKAEAKPLTVPEAEVPQEEEKPKPAEVTLALPKSVLGEVEKLKGTLEAVLLDSKWTEIGRVKVKDLFNAIQSLEQGKAFAVIFDGIITQRLVDLAAERGVTLLIGARMGTKLSYRPPNVRVLTFSDIT